MLQVTFFAEYNEESNEKGPKSKVGDHVRISKFKMYLLKVMHLIGAKKFLLLKKRKNTVPWTYVISDLNREEIVGSFY